MEVYGEAKVEIHTFLTEFSSVYAMKACRDMELEVQESLTLALDGINVLPQRPNRFTSGKGSPALV
jgi:hypothetical protein